MWQWVANTVPSPWVLSALLLTSAVGRDFIWEIKNAGKCHPRASKLICQHVQRGEKHVLMTPVLSSIFRINGINISRWKGRNDQSVVLLLMPHMEWGKGSDSVDIIDLLSWACGLRGSLGSHEHTFLFFFPLRSVGRRLAGRKFSSVAFAYTWRTLLQLFHVTGLRGSLL